MKNSDFITGRVPITKEEVRAVSIMKLDLVNAKRFIDVGAGTGSVSVEAAYNYPNLEVISIERNDDALDLINKNVEKFNLKNVEVIKAYAPIDIEGEEYLTVKYINQSERGCEWIKLVSYNQHHQPKDFPLSSVRALALVKLSIRMNTMK